MINKILRSYTTFEVVYSYSFVFCRVTLYQGSGEGVQPLGLHISNNIDVRKGFDNREIAMRIKSEVHSRDKFYTDLNGFQMQQRTTYSKVPLQGNFYPMPAMAFIQDSSKR